MAPTSTKPPVPISGANFLNGCPCFNPDRRRCRNKRSCDLLANRDTNAHRKAIELRDQLLNRKLTAAERRVLVKKLLGWVMCTKHMAIIGEVEDRMMEGLREDGGVFVPLQGGVGGVVGRRSGGEGTRGSGRVYYHEDEDEEDDEAYEEEEEEEEDNDDENGDDEEGHEDIVGRDDRIYKHQRGKEHPATIKRERAYQVPPTPRSFGKASTAAQTTPRTTFSGENVFQLGAIKRRSSPSLSLHSHHLQHLAAPVAPWAILRRLRHATAQRANAADDRKSGAVGAG